MVVIRARDQKRAKHYAEQKKLKHWRYLDTTATLYGVRGIHLVTIEPYKSSVEQDRSISHIRTMGGIKTETIIHD